MSETATANPPGQFPWTGLLRWQPFQIDALGLVTLLGAEEVNAAVGRLVQSKWLEYLPLLGAYVIANQRFREKEASYHIYNITRGIHTTDMASWLSRWIKAQNFEQTRSFVRWTYQERKGSFKSELPAITLGVVGLGFLVAMTILSYDWYGFANAMSMASSVMVRYYMVKSLRARIDQQVSDCHEGEGRSPHTKQPSEDLHDLHEGWLGKAPNKILIITTDARAVTMLVPGELLKPPSCFIANLNPDQPQLYSVMRWCGWVAFAVQVVTIGMSDLATQLVTVFLLVVPTVLYVNKFGCDDSQREFPNLASWRTPNSTVGMSGKDLEGANGSTAARSKGKGKSTSTYQYKRSCWIGQYLKAEIYEWPIDHQYVIETQGDKMNVKAVGIDPKKLSDKRQHLYAWLQLTINEKDSLDKWDLFPHEREDGDKWTSEYRIGDEYIKGLNDQPHAHGITAIIRRARKPPDDEKSQARPTSSSKRPAAATIPSLIGPTPQQEQQKRPDTATSTTLKRVSQQATTTASDPLDGPSTPPRVAPPQQQSPPRVRRPPRRSDTALSEALSERTIPTPLSTAMYVSADSRRRQSVVAATTVLPQIVIAGGPPHADDEISPTLSTATQGHQGRMSAEEVAGGERDGESKQENVGKETVEMEQGGGI